MKSHSRLAMRQQHIGVTPVNKGPRNVRSVLGEGLVCAQPLTSLEVLLDREAARLAPVRPVVTERLLDLRVVAAHDRQLLQLDFLAHGGWSGCRVSPLVDDRIQLRGKVGDAEVEVEAGDVVSKGVRWIAAFLLSFDHPLANMFSRDKRPTVPIPPRVPPRTPQAQMQFNPAQSHPAFLPLRVHVTAIPRPPNQPPSPPVPSPQQHQWTDPSQVSPAWEGWGRGPAEANVGKSRL